MPSSGFCAVRKKCVTVVVDGCGLAPPTVVDVAWSAESEITTGAGAVAASADDASNGVVRATPTARASFGAHGRNIRSPLNEGGPATHHAPPERRWEETAAVTEAR